MIAAPVALQALKVLFWLLAAHAVCDFPLQGDFMARAKVTTRPLPGVPAPLVLVWHALIHAAAVTALTNSYRLGLVEFVAHYGIDELKNRGLTGFAEDQALHATCKVLYVLVAAVSPGLV
jgi:hypothetical protein